MENAGHSTLAWHTPSNLAHLRGAETRNLSAGTGTPANDVAYAQAVGGAKYVDNQKTGVFQKMFGRLAGMGTGKATY